MKQLTVLCTTLILVAGFGSQALAEMVGAYVIKDKKFAQKSAHNGIERALANLSVFIRGKVRDRLRAQQRVCLRVDIALVGEDVEIACRTNGRKARSAASGTVRTIQIGNGKSALLSHKVASSSIVQTLQQGKTRRTATYRLGADGKTMTVDIELASDKLDTPVRYRLVYSRR
ncbi:MAG: hypothetical protein MJE77_02905 [Proteobacteria bacterium]|nr:hypothetical protein [Pseudomonadota bacterium]